MRVRSLGFLLVWDVPLSPYGAERRLLVAAITTAALAARAERRSRRSEP